jgi:hypothetical protein
MKVLYFVSFILFAISAAGQVDYPPCSAFDTIGKDTLRVINSHSNSLYSGIDNLIELRHIPYKKLLIECSPGIVMEDEKGLYNIIPSKSGYANIFIYQLDSIDTTICFQKTLRVLYLPQPYITLEREEIKDRGNIFLKKLDKIREFEVHLSEDLVDDSKWFKIKSIEIGYKVGQLYASKINQGSKVSDEILKLLRTITPGSELTFVFTIEGQGDVFKRLAPIKVRLM